MLGCLPGVHGAAAGNARPNLMVILADDMGWSDLGCYGEWDALQKHRQARAKGSKK